MIIVWRGWGIIVPLLVFGVGFGLETLVGVRYWQKHAWPFAFALLCAGGVIWLADWWLYGRPDRIKVDKKTGQRWRYAPCHDFFFLRMRWWSAILAATALLLVIFNWSPGP